MSLWAPSTRHARASPAKVSVNRRLSLLMLSELIAAAAIVVVAILALARLADERAYMDRYVFAPLLDIGDAQVAGSELRNLLLPGRSDADVAARARGPISRLRGFIERYQRDWETGVSALPEARRLRAELERQGVTFLLEQEHEAVGATVQAVHSLELTTSAPAEPPLRAGDVAALNHSLVQLNQLNLRYVKIEYRAFERIHRAINTAFIGVSLAGIVLAGLLGLRVRQAIAPRVRRMVRAVERFREVGAYELIDDEGEDDLAVLAHTLGLSFRSIAGRDKERERFLAVAAHELKTPLTTLKGFAQVALAHRDDPAVRERALAVIDRQSTRLARLVQDLLWSARAGAGQLRFHPAPVNLEALSRQVIEEVRLVCDGQVFTLDSCPDPHILGDSHLLEQILWNLMFQAATITPVQDPVRIDIEGTATRVRLTVAARSHAELPDDLDDLIQPFLASPFESRQDGPRSTGLGLYLAREIARLHGARFEIERRPGSALVSWLEFRR
jgi:signal transduction histidine kinase